MSKNIITILLIFILPLCVYWGLTRDKLVTALPGVASTGAEVIKFSSPMCYEWQELEKVVNEGYPACADKVTLRKIDVSQRNNKTNELIKAYDVKLVPTCIFKDKNGNTIRRTEGSMQPRILENYIKEQLNG